MGTPWLSVIMPVHHGDRWLGRTLESAAGEPLEGIEFLILDSSRDRICEDIVAGYANRLPIAYRRCPDLLAWTAKTNVGASSALGTHLMMLHQDDLWLPGRVVAIRRLIAAWPDAALLLSPSWIIDGDDRRRGLWRCPLACAVPLGAREVGERLLIQNFIAIPAPVIRRDAWLAAEGMDEALWYTADWDLYLKLAQQGTTVYSPVPTTAFRIHAGSLTVTGSRDRAAFVSQMERVIDRHIDLVAMPKRHRTLKTARKSACINGALAAAARGDNAALTDAARALIGMNPVELIRYLRDSRLFERVWPRFRAQLAGSF